MHAGADIVTEITVIMIIFKIYYKTRLEFCLPIVRRESFGCYLYGYGKQVFAIPSVLLFMIFLNQKLFLATVSQRGEQGAVSSTNGRSSCCFQQYYEECKLYWFEDSQ